MNANKQAGFTLIELLVVIMIVSLASIILIPTFSHHHICSRRSACSSNLSQLGKAMLMYADSAGNGGMFPTRAMKGENELYDGDAQEALTLLYALYVSDIRVFSCQSKPLDPNLMKSIQKVPATGWSSTGMVSFKQARPGVPGFSSSYGYSPGHAQDNEQGQVIVLADRQGTGPKGNSDNHGLDAGQSCLAVGGNVEWRDGIINNMGETVDHEALEDPNIFSKSKVSKSGQYPSLDSFCR